MREQIISLETAKLAKEKGFKESCLHFYFEDGELRENSYNDTYGYYGEPYTIEIGSLLGNWNDGFKTNKEGNRCFGYNSSKYLETFSAPIQSLLQKWLREVHKIYIFVEPTLGDEFVEFAVYGTDNEQNDLKLGFGYDSGFHVKTYEEALEVGLFQALNLLPDAN